MANNSEVAHAWAHNHDRAHFGSHLSHHDGYLMSYGTCIGQRLEINDKVIYITDYNSYSNSTSKHQAEMRSAIPVDALEFTYPWGKWGRDRIVWRYSNETLVRLGLELLAKDYVDCLNVAGCNKLEHNFGRSGYEQMVKFYEATGVTTVNKLLRMKASEFGIMARNATPAHYAFKAEKQLKKFLKMMHEGADIPAIVDVVNGKGTWEAYLKRTSGLRVAAKNRRLSAFIGTQVNSKVIAQHTKAGDLIPWMMKCHKQAQITKDAAKERSSKAYRQCKSMRRLELHLGMAGFLARFGIYGSKPKFSQFNYNGTVINFAGTRGYSERTLTDKEYQEFVECTDKEAWIRAKRQWMLESLQTEKRDYDNYMVRLAEEERIRKEEEERRKELEEQNRKYIAEQKALGADGYRRLYHEGFQISQGSIPYEAFDGGNVLLRYNSIRNVIETSKGIKLEVAQGKRLWNIFQKWHEQSLCEKGFEIDTLSGHYNVHSFNGNVLTAGCHQIAFSEMQYIANRLNF